MILLVAYTLVQAMHRILPAEQIPARVMHTILPVVQIAVWMVFLSSVVSFSAFSVSVPELVQLVL